MKWWVKPYLETELKMQKFKSRMIDFKQVPHWFKEKITDIDFDFYVISDTHFYHHKIAEYCDRPENWDDLIVSNWNEAINDSDVVLHLGDFAFGNQEMTQEKIRTLNGEIILLKGNHDRHGNNWFIEAGISAVIKNPFIWQGNDNRILFSHVPQWGVVKRR